MTVDHYPKDEHCLILHQSRTIATILKGRSIAVEVDKECVRLPRCPRPELGQMYRKQLLSKMEISVALVHSCIWQRTSSSSFICKIEPARSTSRVYPVQTRKYYLYQWQEMVETSGKTATPSRRRDHDIEKSSPLY